MPFQVNITTQVNSKTIRREEYNGREHLVLPSYTLPANVIMNGGLYTSEQIDKHYKGLEGTLAPLGHPQVNGLHVSAFSPEGINVGHVGAWNRNVKKSGNRVYVEKWVDVEVAKSSAQGRELLDRVEALERGDDVPPIHTSVAAFLEKIDANEAQKAQGAEWVADIELIDHDAILLNEVGAATPEQGVGLMVNADQAKALTVNAGSLIGESYRERERRLERAARKRFSTDDSYVWVADFTDAQAILVVEGVTQVYGYKDEAGTITFDDNGTPVERQESWVAIAANKVKKIFNPQARPVITEKEDAMSLTPEEKAELVKDIGAALSANMKEQLEPITQAVAELQANQKTLSDTLTANSRAEEATKREAVAAKLGEVVANSLSGEALDAAFTKLSQGVDIAPNAATSKADDQKFDEVPD